MARSTGVTKKWKRRQQLGFGANTPPGTGVRHGSRLANGNGSRQPRASRQVGVNLDHIQYRGRPQPTEAEALPEVVIRSGEVRCPGCGNTHYIHSPREETCGGFGGCGARFKAVRASSDALATSLRRAQIDSWGDVLCPHCEEWTMNANPGTIACSYCRASFEAYR